MAPSSEPESSKPRVGPETVTQVVFLAESAWLPQSRDRSFKDILYLPLQPVGTRQIIPQETFP